MKMHEQLKLVHERIEFPNQEIMVQLPLKNDGTSAQLTNLLGKMNNAEKQVFIIMLLETLRDLTLPHMAASAEREILDTFGNAFMAKHNPMKYARFMFTLVKDARLRNTFRVWGEPFLFTSTTEGRVEGDEGLILSVYCNDMNTLEEWIEPLVKDYVLWRPDRRVISQVYRLWLGKND